MKYKVKKSWGASVRGPGHILSKLPNQDSFLIKQTHKGFVAIVSDGLGSKRHSSKGSKQACLSVLEAIKKFEKNKKENISLKDLFASIQKNWELSLKKQNYQLKHCSATCLFVYIQKESILTARLGDGMIFLLANTEKNHTLISDEKEDSFSNTTYCLTSSDVLNKWDFSTFKKSDFSSVVLCTDGISNDIKEDTIVDFIKELRRDSLRNKRSVNVKNMEKALLQWPVKGHSDDKTIVFVEV